MPKWYENEPFTSEGVEKIIFKNKNLILFTEPAPMFLGRTGPEPRDYVSQLKKFGFEIQVIDEYRHSLESATDELFAKEEPSWHANLFLYQRVKT